MALIACRECKQQVSTTAVTCPHCGAKVPKSTGLLTIVIAGFIGLFVVMTLLSYAVNWVDTKQKSSAEADMKAKVRANIEKEKQRVAALTPEQREAEQKQRAEQEAKRQEQEKARKDATAKAEAEKKRADDAVNRAMVGAKALRNSMRNPDSFKMISALVIDGSGAVCYEYRAQNGFGGMNVGKATLSSDGKKFLSSEQEGFASLWNRECAKKRGQDVTAAVNLYAL
jgi:flagellar biosynthesis GTPase FlhF